MGPDESGGGATLCISACDGDGQSYPSCHICSRTDSYGGWYWGGGEEEVREGGGREGKKREEGREEREGREVGRWVGRLGETRRECT